jgi:hypothetical protein
MFCPGRLRKSKSGFRFKDMQKSAWLMLVVVVASLAAGCAQEQTVSGPPPDPKAIPKYPRPGIGGAGSPAPTEKAKNNDAQLGN